MSGNTDFCSYMYILVCRCSLICICDSDFGITPVHDITVGNYYYNYYYYYVAHHRTIDQRYPPLNLTLPLTVSSSRTL